MPRRLIRKLTDRLRPAVDRITASPAVQRFAPALADPGVWHLNRRSTARAVAIGLFCGLIPGPLQVLGSIGLCLWFRATFPLAVITTFYTNPLTIVPLYLVAYEYGRLFFPDSAAIPPAFHLPAGAAISGFMPALSTWVIGLGKPLAVGIFLLATTLAATGWAVVRVGWRCHAVWAWRRRARRRLHGTVAT